MITTLLSAALTVAATSSGVASTGCFDLPETRELKPYAPQPANLQATILVDNSLVLPEIARRQMSDAVRRLAVPGSEVAIGSFSSYSSSLYPKITLSIRFDTPLPAAAESRVSRRKRDLVKRCIVWRQKEGVARLEAALQRELNAARPTIGQTAIMSSLQQFGERVRSSPARTKLIVLGSDMLENSTTTTFYKAGRLRRIDAEKELTNAVAHRMLANLSQTRIYVVGFALQNGDAPVPVDHVQRLETFWREYFRRSDAGPVRFGKPLILGEIP